MDTPAAPAAPVVEAPVVPVVEVPVGDTAAPEAPKPERTFTQAELDEIIRKKDSKRLKERDELRRRLAITEELALKATRQEKAPEPAGPVDGEPKREQFDSYESYIEARAEWRADKKVDAKLKERDNASKDQETKAAHEKAATEFRNRTKDAAKGIEDFEDVMAEATSDESKPVSRLAADPIQACDNPAKVLYHLAKNPEEAERIASLSVVAQAREIWKLEASLASAPAPKKPSKAPEPIAPVGGKEMLSDKMPDPKTDEKGWIKWREKQVRTQRKG